MSQLSIPLQPVATPTNQFVAPSIRPPANNAASQLSQLSSALSQVAPELSHVYANQFQSYVQGSQARANEDFQKQRFENTQALKKAVQDGKLPEADNPWYIVQLRQDVAANEAQDKVNQMRVDWENSPVRFSDDPRQVETWAQQQLASVTDGRDAYESEAIAPVVQQGIGSLVNYHMDVRREERQQERVQNFQTRVSNVLSSPDQSQAALALKTLIADARQTMPGAAVNELVEKAALDSAEATGSDDVFKTLAQIPNTGAGGTLADLPNVKIMQQKLPLLRMQRDLQAEEALAHQQKLQAEQRKSALLDNLMKASGYRPEKVQITPELAQQWGIPFQDVVEINKQALQYGQDQESAQDKGTQKQAQSLLGQAESDIAAGKIRVNDPEVTDTLSRIAVLSPESANQFNRFLYDFYTMQGRNSRLYAQDTDPQTLSDLWNQAKAGSLTAEQLIPQAQKLSHEDFTSLLHETTKRTTDVKLSDFPMSNYDQLLKEAVVFGNAKTRDADFGGDFSLAEKDPDVAHRVTLAQTLFAETAHSYLNDPAFTKLPRDQQTAALRKAMDSISQEFGGFTDQQRQQAADEQKRVAETAKSAALVAQHGGQFTENGVTTKADGTQIGAATTLTDGARKNIRDVQQKLFPDQGFFGRTFSTLGRAAVGNFSSPPDNNRSLEDMYLRPNTLNDPNRAAAYLQAYVHNANLAFGGGLQFRSAVAVNDPLIEGGTLHFNYSDARDVDQTSKILMRGQRNQLAEIRQNLEKNWINPATEQELNDLTASLSGKLAAGQAVDPGEAERFRELANNYRLHDFLGVVAGVTPEEIRKNYKVLYDYPAASNINDLKDMLPLIDSVAPQSEHQAILEHQRFLITRANELLTNGKYLP